jgi:hypothetical protein
MIKKESQRVNESDPDWIKELVEGLEERNLKNFSDYQKRMLRKYFFKNLNNGIKPKDAIEKSIEYVTSCKE